MTSIRPRLLLTGATGQIGWNLSQLLPDVGEVVAVDRATMDLSRPDSIRDVVRSVQPDVIINAAGYTAVDRAEEEEDLALAVNGDAPGILAEEADRAGAALVHYSTDYVFDGSADRPYRPDDAPTPLNVYGRTKLAGEERVRAVGGSSVILRVSWIYGRRGQNFFLTMLRLAAARERLSIVSDQFGSPTPSRLIAEATVDLLSRWLVSEADGMTFGEIGGLYHLACSGSTSWHDFASRIFELADLDSVPEVVPIPTTAYETPAARPRYSVLDCSRTRDLLGIELPSWETALEGVFKEDVSAVGEGEPS